MIEILWVSICNCSGTSAEKDTQMLSDAHTNNKTGFKGSISKAIPYRKHRKKWERQSLGEQCN